MEQAIRERVGLYHGLELPIECYHIHSKGRESAREPHYHEYIEFLYASGECDISVWIAGEWVEFCTGDLLIVNSNTPHTFFPRLKLNEYACVKALPSAICFSENSYFDARYVSPFLENNIVRYRKFSSEQLSDGEIAGFFRDALSEWKSKAYGYEVSLRSLVFRIFLWAIRNGGEQDELAPFDRENGTENVALIQAAVEYIGANFATVTELDAAMSINMSYSHFSRLFKRVMGRSFKEYLTSTRINAAERMLFETDVPITEIALACGFATSSHFIDRFKRAKGITPKQYRRAFEKK